MSSECLFHLTKNLRFGEVKYLLQDHTVNRLDTELNPDLSPVLLHVSHGGASQD